VHSVLGRLPAPGQREFLARGDRLETVWRDLERMLDEDTDWAATCAQLASAPPVDRVVATAVDGIVASGGSMPMTHLARAAGLSERQFRRRFVAATGIAPKFYADVQRVRRALILSLEDSDWAGVAAEAGFADQPHLTRDVKERFGAAPGRIGGYFRGMRHELVAPADGRIVQDDEAQAA
jgi:AraC-like DNA-binding protein